MGGSKKTNPRRQVCTGADVRRAEDRGIVIGLRQALKIALYILLDKHAAPAEDVQELAREFTWLAERINEGRISWSFVDRVLEENDVEVRLR